MAEVYVVADTHFGDEAIIQYENRPFRSIEEMTQTMVERWNEKVMGNDTIFVLGDCTRTFSCFPMNRCMLTGTCHMRISMGMSMQMSHTGIIPAVVRV